MKKGNPFRVPFWLSPQSLAAGGDDASPCADANGFAILRFEGDDAVMSGVVGRFAGFVEHIAVDFVFFDGNIALVNGNDAFTAEILQHFLVDLGMEPGGQKPPGENDEEQYGKRSKEGEFGFSTQLAFLFLCGRGLRLEFGNRHEAGEKRFRIVPHALEQTPGFAEEMFPIGERALKTVSRTQDAFERERSEAARVDPQEKIVDEVKTVVFEERFGEFEDGFDFPIGIALCGVERFYSLFEIFHTFSPFLVCFRINYGRGFAALGF